VLKRLPGWLKFCCTFGAVTFAFTGWWFIRNYLLYGDISAQRGLHDHGYTNAPPPVSIHSLHEVGHWIYQIVAYYWFPTEYYRMLFHAPVVLRAFAAIVIVMATLGWLLWSRSTVGIRRVNRGAGIFLAICFSFCLGIYTYSCFRLTFFAARTTFSTFVVYAIAICIGLSAVDQAIKVRGRSIVVPALVCILLVANGLMLFRVAKLPVYPFTLFQ
jgi:hypothetical protein